MDVIASGPAFRQACDEARARPGGATVGLVPTMGALHGGHRSLLARARAECDIVALSIFVNPMQFGSPADLGAYPRPLERDLEVAEAADCDLVFTPDQAEMYPSGRPEVTVDPGPLGDRFEGVARPGHFRGVLTIVAKLFNLTGPCRAYFGQKDFQQLTLVQQMISALTIPAEVAACPTVRDADGLALSSRNARLSDEERSAALSLARGLAIAARLAQNGEREPAVLSAEMARRIAAEPLARLDYAAVIDEHTWHEPTVTTTASRALVAASFGETRLIDNLPLVWEAGAPAR